MSDRSYQNDLKLGVYNTWQSGQRNVIAQLPTGGGKTHVASEIVSEFDGNTAVIAHRQELVGQLSLALARQGVEHQLIAPKDVGRFVMREHVTEVGRCYVTPRARAAVVGIDTLLARKRHLKDWAAGVGLWVTDECHHILRANKWGKGVAMMPNAFGLGLTATPCRADGAGLGRHADGVFDTIVEGPSMRELMGLGFLAPDYRIFAPPSDVNYSDVHTGSTGDFIQQQLRDAVRGSHLVGDVVEHYQRIAPGKLGITFCESVATCEEVAGQFNAAGVPAAVVSAKTPNAVRADLIRQFRNRQLLQLVNVDLFGEGFDLPAVEVVSMARRTMSYGLYAQQFGRMLRPSPGKTHGILIDHAGNVKIHGLPDRPRVWTLDRREGSPRTASSDDSVPLTYCQNCTQPFPRTSRTCPHCGHYQQPSSRSAPEHVDGDLLELDPATLAAMREELATADRSPDAVVDSMRRAGAPEVACRGASVRIRDKQEAQTALRESVAWFAHVQAQGGHDNSYTYRLFYHLFGTDVLSAQLLGRREALALAERINEYLGETR